LLVTILC